MYQLINTDDRYPPSFWRLVDKDIEWYLKTLAPDEQRRLTLPTIILNPAKAYEYSESVPPFETWEIGAFGLYLAVHWLGHSFGGADTDADEPLPDVLVERIRNGLGPSVPDGSLEEFESELAGLTYASLSNALHAFTELSDRLTPWPSNGDATPVNDIYYEHWQDYCERFARRIHDLRVSHLAVRTDAFEGYDVWGAYYERERYADYLKDLDEHGVEVVPREAMFDSDTQAILVYRHRLRGGGFSCMS